MCYLNIDRASSQKLVSPHALQEAMTTEHLARVSHKKGEKIELARCQRNGASVHNHPPPKCVDLNARAG